MARVSPLQTSVNAGEFSPRMDARVDFDRYQTACKKARNCVLLPTGGFTKRPGTKYRAAVMDETKVGNVVGFQFSATDAALLEFGENGMRVLAKQAQLTCNDVDASVSNGTFTSNITDWDDRSTGSASIAHDAAAGRLQLTGASDSVAWAEQDVTTTSIGVEHVLRFKVEGTLGASIHVQVGSSSTGSELYAEEERGIGWHTIQFTPSASPFYIQFRNKMPLAENLYIDDVEILDNAPLQITHDYTEAQVGALRTLQTADVVYLFHPSVGTRKVQRFGTHSWAIVDVAWVDGPYDEINPGTDLQDRQLIDNPDFFDGMSGWTNRNSNNGTLRYDSSLKAMVLGSDLQGDFGAVGQAIETGVSGTNVFVLHFNIIGTIKSNNSELTYRVGTSLGGTQLISSTPIEQGWHSVRFTSSASTIYFEIRNSSPAVDSGVSTVEMYNESANLLELSGTEGDVTCTALGDHEPFSSTDVGRSIRLSWPGKESTWGVISGYTDAQTVTIRLRRKAPFANIPTESWQLGTWSSANGYPTLGGYFQSRFIVANTTTKPQTFWFTQTFELENMRPDSFSEGANVTEDDDAFEYTINAEQVDPIAWIGGQRDLLIGTAGEVYAASASGKTIKPSDIQVDPHASVPSKIAPVIRQGNATIFLDSTGRRLHDLGFSFDDDSFVDADLVILADHVTRSPIEEMVIQKRPHSIIWARRADGRLISLAYNRRQQIIGWTQHIVGGDAICESLAIIPGSDDGSQDYTSGERDEVWGIFKRTINGATHRYIEFLEGYYEGPVREDYTSEALWQSAVQADMADAFYVDSGVTYSGSATTSITGLDHLEGETVRVLADGKVHPDKTVASGAITLDYSASKVQVGLGFDLEFESLKLAAGTQSGTALAKTKQVDDIALALLDTGTFNLGLAGYDEKDGRVKKKMTTIDFQKAGFTLDAAVPLFTGEIVRSPEASATRDPRILIEQANPLPLTSLAIAPRMESKER